MPFRKGNKHGKGGKREGAGKPTREHAKIKSQAAELVLAMLEKDIKPVMIKYLKFAKDDPATARHAVDKLLPAARQEIDITGGLKIIKINSFDPDDGK